MPIYPAYPSSSASISSYYQNEIVVRSPEDLSGTLSSNDVYFIDGIIDYTGSGFDIVIPAGGLNLKGHSFDVSKIICSDTDFSLFNSPVGGSGNLVLGNSSTLKLYIPEVTL